MAPRFRGSVIPSSATISGGCPAWRPGDQVVGVRVLVGPDPQGYRAPVAAPAVSRSVRRGPASIMGMPAWAASDHGLADPLVGVQPRPACRAAAAPGRAADSSTALRPATTSAVRPAPRVGAGREPLRPAPAAGRRPRPGAGPGRAAAAGAAPGARAAGARAASAPCLPAAACRSRRCPGGACRTWSARPGRGRSPLQLPSGAVRGVLDEHPGVGQPVPDRVRRAVVLRSRAACRCSSATLTSALTTAWRSSPARHRPRLSQRVEPEHRSMPRTSAAAWPRRHVPRRERVVAFAVPPRATASACGHAEVVVEAPRRSPGRRQAARRRPPRARPRRGRCRTVRRARRRPGHEALDPPVRGHRLVQRVRRSTRSRTGSAPGPR